MTSQTPSPNGAGPPDSLSVPQDTKSNPSHGLVERLREAACFAGGVPVIEEILDEAADALALYRQEGVISSQRGENGSANASMGSGADSLPDALNELAGEVFYLATSDGPTNATWEQYTRSRLKWLAGKLVALGREAATPIGGLSLGVEGDQGASVAGLPAHVAEATATDAQHSAGKEG